MILSDQLTTMKIECGITGIDVMGYSVEEMLKVRCLFASKGKYK